MVLFWKIYPWTRVWVPSCQRHIPTIQIWVTPPRTSHHGIKLANLFKLQFKLISIIWYPFFFYIQTYDATIVSLVTEHNTFYSSHKEIMHCRIYFQLVHASSPPIKCSLFRMYVEELSAHHLQKNGSIDFVKMSKKDLFKKN